MKYASVIEEELSAASLVKATRAGPGQAQSTQPRQSPAFQDENCFSPKCRRCAGPSASSQKPAVGLGALTHPELAQQPPGLHPSAHGLGRAAQPPRPAPGRRVVTATRAALTPNPARPRPSRSPISTWRRRPTRKWRGGRAPGARSRGSPSQASPRAAAGVSPASRSRTRRRLPPRSPRPPPLSRVGGAEARLRGRREPGPAGRRRFGSYQPGRRRSRAARGGGRAAGPPGRRPGDGGDARRRPAARGGLDRAGGRAGGRPGDVDPCASAGERDPRSGGVPRPSAPVILTLARARRDLGAAPPHSP